MCLSCLSLLCPLRFSPHCHLYARMDCAIMEGLVILSLCLLGPPHFSATAHYTSLVGSAKKVVVGHSFCISCEMQFLCFLELEKRKRWLSTCFPAFHLSYCWKLRSKFIEVFGIMLTCSISLVVSVRH